MTHPLESSIRQHVDYLCRQIGVRAAGSAANRTAENYIAAQMESAGWMVERQDYACSDWDLTSIEMTLNGAPLAAAANRFSPACNLTAGFVALCSSAQLEAADLDGKIALLYGHLSRQPLPTKGFPYKDEEDARVVDLLEAKRPAAVLCVQQNPLNLNLLVEDDEFTLPSATLPVESGAALLQNRDGIIHLRIDARTIPSRAANVVGTKSGMRPAKAVFCAHFDTKIGTPGALDNGGGSAVLLALAEALKERQTGCTVELIAFNNEEYLPIGDDEYLRRKEGELDSILGVINFDGVGDIFSTDTITVTAGSETFNRAVLEIGRKHGLEAVEPWVESNHSTFGFRGIPAGAASSKGAFAIAHTTADTLLRMDIPRLPRLVDFALELIDWLALQPLDSLR